MHDAIREMLDSMKAEHRRLDEQITALSAEPQFRSAGDRAPEATQASAERSYPADARPEHAGHHCLKSCPTEGLIVRILDRSARISDVFSSA